jgi:Bacterial Ig-like domain (group 2)
MAYLPNPTTGLAVAAQVEAGVDKQQLSLSGTNIYQIVPALRDGSTAAKPGAAFVLTSVANAAAGVSVYTGTVTGGAANALVGTEQVVTGFVTPANNGVFVVTASTATTLTLANAGGVAETHAGTSTEEGASAFTYVSRNPAYVTVSSTGLVTGVKVGHSVVEVSYPTYDNSHGLTPRGLPLEKIYDEISFHVKL